jgi:hypothetical protein
LSLCKTRSISPGDGGRGISVCVFSSEKYFFLSANLVSEVSPGGRDN